MKGLGNVMYKLLASVSWVHKNQCMSVCVCVRAYVRSCTTEPCGPLVTWPSHVSVQGPGPNTEAILYH